jgi:hypothetical protein
VKVLSPERIKRLVKLAEQARTALSDYVGYEVVYDNVGVQLLDEWIDRHLRQFPQPSQKMRLAWVSFLGEMFRRHHWGEWAFEGDDERETLAVLCPKGSGGLHIVPVSAQVSRRISEGMSASLAYFYAITSIELRAES